MNNMVSFFIEALETRIAPASLSSPYTLTYTDSDGDLVRVHISKPVFNDSTHFVFEASGAGEILHEIDLPAGAAGASLIVTVAEKAASGQSDGQAVIDLVSAVTSLKRVQVQGTLGAINITGVGHGVGTLDVTTLGPNPPSTPDSFIPGTVANLHVSGNWSGEQLAVGHLLKGQIDGSILGGFLQGLAIGHLEIKGDVRNSDSEADGLIDAEKGIGHITILGSLLGGQIATTAPGNLGSLQIHGQITANSTGLAQISIDGNIGSVTVLGSVNGNDQASSGEILATGNIGRVRIGGDLVGGVVEDANLETADQGSGFILAHGNLGRVEVDGSILGVQAEALSGAVSAKGRIDRVIVHGDIGGVTSRGGEILSGKQIGSVHVDGSLKGSEIEANSSAHLGQIKSGSAVGSIYVGGDFESAYLFVLGRIDDLHIGGSISAPVGNGSIHASSAAHIYVGGDIIGGRGADFGEIQVQRAGTVVIGGSVMGGSAKNTGFLDFSSVRRLLIRGNVEGGTGPDSGEINLGRAGRVRVEGSIQAGTGLASGWLDVGQSDSIRVGKIIDTLTSYNASEVPLSPGDYFSGAIVGGSARSIRIDGSITTATVSSAQAKPSYAIWFSENVDLLQVGGEVSGTAGNRLGIAAGSGYLDGQSLPQTARQLATDGFGTIRIEGLANATEITAGTSATKAGYSMGNPFARISLIDIAGGASAVSIAAGVDPGGDGYFGTSDDSITASHYDPSLLAAPSRIGRVVIHGPVVETDTAGATYAIEAQRVGSVSIDGGEISLPPIPISLVLGPPAQGLHIRQI